jgi:carboxypeptidase Q
MSPRRDPGVKFRTPLKIRRIPGLLSVLLVAVGSFGADSPDVKDATNRLIGSIFNGPSMSNLRDLTDGYGGRLTGSPAYQKATEWAVARFHS